MLYTMQKYYTLLLQLLVSQLSVIRLCQLKILYDIIFEPNKVKLVKMQCTIRIAHLIRKYSIHNFGKYSSFKYA